MHSQTESEDSIDSSHEVIGGKRSLLSLPFALESREERRNIASGEETKSPDSCASEWQSLYVFVPSCTTHGNHIQIQSHPHEEKMLRIPFSHDVFHVSGGRDLLKHVLAL